MIEPGVRELILRPTDDHHTGIGCAIRSHDRDSSRMKVIDGIALGQEITGHSRELTTEVGGRRHRRGYEQVFGNRESDGTHPGGEGGTAGSRGIRQEPERDLPRRQLPEQIRRAGHWALPDMQHAVDIDQPATHGRQALSRLARARHLGHASRTSSHCRRSAIAGKNSAISSHGRRCRSSNRRPALTAAVRGGAHARSTGSIRGIHLALAADQAFGTRILHAGRAFTADP
jgi:hypothetical protein